jgi:hypothetical protein
MVSLTNTIGAQSFTTSGQCLNWFATQTDKMIFNIDYPAVVTNGLVLNMDAAFVPSYSTSGTSWYSIGVSGNTGTLVNGPTYSDGSIVFDGTNDGVSITPTPTITSAFTFNMWVNKTQSKDNAAIIAIQGTLWQIDNNVIYWWSNVNFGPMSHSFSSTLNQWYNFCITQDNRTAKLYINSTLVRTTTMTDVSTTRGDNTIGGWGIGGRPWLGKISLTQIYNRVLTDSEIAQNYEAIGTRYTSLSVQYLVIGGGGGPGMGGGGAGGYLESTTTSLTTQTNYTITVGGGGPGFASGASGIGTKGSDSVFSTITATGGGYGGNGGASSGPGGPGGSGGGGGGYSGGQGGAGNTPSTSPSQGNNGGNGNNVAPQGSGWLGGGGGGAGGVGGNFVSTTSGNGGSGTSSSITGSAVSRAGGGAGGGNSGLRGTATSGGGNANTSGTVNTGGGGGGRDWGNPGGAGGSGIVILKIPDVYNANFSSGVSFTKSTSVSGYKIYIITATSTTSETVSFS